MMKQRFTVEDYECLRIEAASAGYEGKLYKQAVLEVLAKKILQTLDIAPMPNWKR